MLEEIFFFRAPLPKAEDYLRHLQDRYRDEAKWGAPPSSLSRSWFFISVASSMLLALYKQLADIPIGCRCFSRIDAFPVIIPI